MKILGLTWWVVALLAFLLIYGGWTLSVEGRRHATDRIATAAVYLTAAAAIIPWRGFSSPSSPKASPSSTSSS